MPDQQASYSLMRPNLIEFLKDRESFRGAIAYNYNLLASRVGCQVRISKSRLGDVHDYWLEDEVRTLKDGMPGDTTQLDHFKQAAFISFWLRRMQPINEINVVAGWDADPGVDKFRRRKRFLRYGQEYCALIVGFQICLNYEAEKVFPDEGSTSPFYTSRLDFLRSTKFPENLISDFVMVLKHKNMSPYGMYLLYKSLFCHPTIGERDATGRAA